MNETQRFVFVLIFFAACILVAVLGLRAFRLRRKVSWAFSFVVLCSGSLFWLLANILRLLVPTQPAWTLAGLVGQPGIAVAAYGLMTYSFQITGQAGRLPRVMSFVYIPLIALFALLAWTNGWHHLIWIGWPSPAAGSGQPGSLYPLYYLVVYTQIMVVLAVLMRSYLIGDGNFRILTGMLLAGVLFLVIVGLAEDFLGGDVIWGVDEAALSMLVTIAIFAVVTLRFGSFTVIPVAYKMMVDNMRDGLVVLDRDDQIMAWNPAALTLLEAGDPVRVGGAFGAVLSRCSPEAQAAWREGKPEFEVNLDGASRRSLRFATRALVEGGAASAGRMVVIYDITQQKEFEQRLHQIAINDPLTGCFNRGHFMECASKQFRQAQRYKRPLSLAMIDLDHFKHINDDYGHAEGDRVLKRVVAACLAALRRSDIFARYGGEEFVVLMPETQAADALLVAERLREAISGQFSQGAAVTASIGVAQMESAEVPDLDRLLDRADQALYQAKLQGRNRVVLWKE